MAGIRRSARIITVKGICGHDIIVSLPPGELGTKGQQRITEAKADKCWNCTK